MNQAVTSPSSKHKTGRLFGSRGYAMLMLLLLSRAVVADEALPRWEDDDYSYDQARRALSRGDVLAIEDILERLKTQIPGQVLEVEFEQEYDRWMYEIKLIDAQGRRLKAKLDAQTGQVLSVEGR